MDDKIFDNIHDVDLKETMETSYIDQPGDDVCSARH